MLDDLGLSFAEGSVRPTDLFWVLAFAALATTSVVALVDRVYSSRVLPVGFGRVLAVFLTGISLYAAQGLLLLAIGDARVMSSGDPNNAAAWLTIATASLFAGLFFSDEDSAHRRPRLQLIVFATLMVVLHQVGVVARLPGAWTAQLLIPSLVAALATGALLAPVVGLFTNRAETERSGRRSPLVAGPVLGIASTLPFALATLYASAQLAGIEFVPAEPTQRLSWMVMLFGLIAALHGLGWMLALQVTRRRAVAGREVLMLQASVDALLEDSPDWFGVLDEQERVLAAGGRWPDADDGGELTLRPGSDFAERLVPELLDGVREGIAAARLRPGQPIEREIRHGDGAQRKVLALRVVDRSHDPGVLGVVIVARDRSDEVARLDELDRRRELYRNSFETVPLAMLVVDARSNTIVDANPAAIALYGYRREAFIGLPTLQLMPHHAYEDIERFRRNVDEDVAGSELVTENRRANGSMFQARSISARILDPRGPQRLVIVEDVSEARRADRLRSSEVTLLETLVRSDSDAAFLAATVRWLADRQAGRFQLAVLWSDESQGCSAQLGASATVDGWLAGDAGRAAVQALAGPRPDRLVGPQGAIWACAVRDGVGRVVGAVAVGPADPEQPDEETAALLDVAARLTAFAVERQAGASSRRRADQLETLGRVAGSVAHDFNNLLTVVLGEADLLRDLDHLGDDGRDHVESIVESAQRASTIARRLLAMSRNQPRRREQLDVAHVFDDVRSWLGPVIGDALSLAVTVDEGALPVETDRALLEAALLNLAINARDALDGGGALALRARGETLASPRDLLSGPVPAGRYAVLTVEDDGPGIDESSFAHLLDPFFSTRPGAGTGLGLPMVANFALESGGGFDLRNIPQGGVAASIWLPLAAETAASPSEPAPAPAPRSARVLLVEDEALVARFIQRTLERSGYVVEHVDSADAARDRFDAGVEADLVLSDVILPGDLDGIMLARWLASAHPEQRVLLSSGYASDGLPEDVRARMLPKPYDAATLLAAVEEALSQAPGTARA